MEVHVTVGLIHCMVNLGNELLGSEGETDVAFLKVSTKRLGETLWFQEKSLESLENLG